MQVEVAVMQEAPTTGWSSQPLSELIAFATGGAWGDAPDAVDGKNLFEVACIRGTDFRDWDERKARAAVTRGLDAKSLEKRKLQAGDILLEVSGGGPEQPVGRTILIDQEAVETAAGRPMVPTNFLRLLRLKEDVDPAYVNYYLKYFYVTGDINDYQGGSNNLRNLRFKDYVTIQVPLAPLPQQRRIVEAIELQLGRLDAAVARLQGAKARLKRYKQAVLTSATTGNLRAEDGSAVTPVVIGKPNTPAPKGWHWSLLLDVAKLESGHTPRKTVKEYWEGGDVPWICLQDIREADGTVIRDTKFHPTMMGIDNSSARLLPEGTVAFSRDISVGFVTIMGKVMATTQHFANWICGDKLNNRFLMYALMASRGPLLQQGQGTTVKTIYMDELQQFHVLHPVIQEQVRIAEEIKSRLDAMAELETTLDAQLQQAVRLRQAVLKRAFEGRLV